MITVVNLNPSIDKSIAVDAFHYGSMNRVQDVLIDAGGKAVNVAIVAKRLGLQVQCVGFLRKENGYIIEEKLAQSGIMHDTVWMPGNIRTNMKVLDREKSIVTEINEAGEPITEDALEDITRRIEALSKTSDFLVFTGSVPPGCPRDYYARMIQKIGGVCQCAIDAEGESLRAGIEALPYLIKPNKMELEMELGETLRDMKEVANASRRFIDKGIARVAVSLGGEGALLSDEHATYFAQGLNVTVKSTVGAGDSMVAGMLHGFSLGLSTEQVLKNAVAAATATIMEAGTGLMRKEIYDDLQKKISIKKV